MLAALPGLAGSIAVAVISVWLYERSRGSLLPIVLFSVVAGLLEWNPEIGPG